MRFRDQKRKQNDKDRCYWCGRHMTPMGGPGVLAKTRDHVIAQADGGNRIVFACKACNELKGNMPPELWVEFRKHHPEWWKLYRGTNFRGMRLYSRWKIDRSA